jgi:hypothetical protein
VSRRASPHPIDPRSHALIGPDRDSRTCEDEAKVPPAGRCENSTESARGFRLEVNGGNPRALALGDSVAYTQKTSRCLRPPAQTPSPFVKPAPTSLVRNTHHEYLRMAAHRPAPLSGYRPSWRGTPVPNPGLPEFRSANGDRRLSQNQKMDEIRARSPWASPFSIHRDCQTASDPGPKRLHLS